MSKRVLFLVVFFLSGYLFSQTNIANELYDNYEYRNAIVFYENAQPLKGENLRRLSDCYFYTHNYAKAVEVYRLILANEKIESQDYLKFGEALKNNQEYEEALSYFYKYQEAHPEDKLVKDLIQQTGFLSRKENIAPRYEVINFKQVNTPIANLFTKDHAGKLFFLSETIETEQGAQLKYDSTKDLSMLDYGTSVRPYVQLNVLDEKSKTPIPFTTEVKFHMNGFDIDFETNEIYFTKIDITKKWKKGSSLPKIYKGKIDLEDYKIYNIVELDIPGFKNKDAIGHPALGYDKKHLYFSADLETGLGGFDIYVSKFENGKWGEPINLGPNVNSGGDEYFPNIMDSVYLYFSSNGRIGYGNQDIYKNRLKTPTLASESQILQAPINSFADDLGFIYNKKTFTGYVTSNRFGGKGDDDIYIVKLLKLTIAGIVKDINGNPVEGALVKLYDENGNLVAETYTDKDGKYSFLVNPGDYEIVVETPDGYVARKKVSVDENWNNDQSIDLNLQNSIAILKGTVYDKEKAVASNTLIKLLSDNGIEVDQLYTNDKGFYTFYAEPNKNYLLVATKKAQAGSKKLSIGSTWDNKQNVDVFMQEATTVQGFLYNEDGSASPLTEISIYDDNGKLIQLSKTDKEGRYQFAIERNQNYQINARKKGFEGVENIYTGANWDSYKDFNIYLFPVTTLAYGYILDMKTKEPISDVRVLLTDNETKRKFIATTNAFGRFEFKISNKRDYLLKLEKDKYYPRTIDIEHNENWGDSVDLTSFMDLNMEYAGYSVLNIYFELGSYVIREDSKAQLLKIVDVLNERPKLNLHVRSYADCRGSVEANKKLTDKRSKAVEDFLKENGIAKDRVSSESMGKTNFVNNCVRPEDCSEEEHGLNRRSEFEFK